MSDKSRNELDILYSDVRSVYEWLSERYIYAYSRRYLSHNAALFGEQEVMLHIQIGSVR